MSIQERLNRLSTKSLVRVFHASVRKQPHRHLGYMFLGKCQTVPRRYMINCFTNQTGCLISIHHLINSCFCFFSSLSETYCSHYDRDTCVMHFKCCSEDKWYPCHKCHNEAVGKEHDKTKDLTVAKDTRRGVSTIPTERSSSEVEENSETEGKSRPRLVYTERVWIGVPR